MKKQEVRGEPLPYRKIHRQRKKITEIRGIYKVWLRAKRYILRLEASNQIRMYVTSDGLLGAKVEAKEFREGFDDHELKRKYWQNKLGVRLIVERV